MARRAFPVVYVSDVGRSARFYERLGFERSFQFPPDAEEPGYVGMRRADAELALVDRQWPEDAIGAELGDGPRFEMFVYVDDVDATVGALRPEGILVLSDPADMPWGERVAYVADPEGNPVALAHPPTRT
jgi:lactoylglutathione lyase